MTDFILHNLLFKSMGTPIRNDMRHVWEDIPEAYVGISPDVLKLMAF